MRTIAVIQPIASMLILLLATGCSGPNESTAPTASTAEASKSAAPPSDEAPTRHDLKALLPLEVAARIAGLDPAAAETSDTEGRLQVREYSWKSERTQQVSNITIPRNDVISLVQHDQRSRSTPEKFHRSYIQPLEPEERERTLTSLKKSKRYLDMDASAQKLAESIMTKALDRPKALAVEGVGDAAAWDEKSSQLYFLSGGDVLYVLVNLSDDDALNLAKAKELAGEAISRM